MKKILFPLIVLIIALISISIYLFCVNKRGIDSNILLEQEVSRLISDKDELTKNLDIITKQNNELIEKNMSLEGQIAENGQQQTELTEKEEEYKKQNQELEKTIDDLRNDISIKSDIISKFESRTMTYTFRIGEEDIWINVTEETIESILGEGIELSYWVDDGENFWYLKGAHQKKVKYGGIEVWYLNDDGKSEFRAIMITATNDTGKLTNGLAVGDSIEKILQLYPSFSDDNKAKNDTYTYSYQDIDSMMGLDIEVSNNKVVRIMVGRIFD